MAIGDLFSTSFLFSIAIIIILIGGLFAYFSYRMAEQDHKLTSMVTLVSILAQDLQLVTTKVISLQKQDTPNVEYSSQLMGKASKLISVSDDGNDDGNDDEEEEEIDDNTTDEEETRCLDEDDCEELENSLEQIKLYNLNLANKNAENDSSIQDIRGEYEELDTSENIKTIHIEKPFTFEETEIPEPEQKSTDMNITGEDISLITNDSYALKNVTITDLEEAEDLYALKSDYKKMSLNKLREVAVTKGVVADASKLKKNEILKMLGDD